MDDGAGQAALQRVVEEHRVEHVARRRVEAEGDVGEAEDDLALRQLARKPFDRLQRPQAELAVVLVAGADGEGQRVEHQIGRGQAMTVAGEVMQPMRNRELALDLLGHALLVDGERDDRGAEAAGKLEALGRRRLAILEIDRVDHGLAAIEAQRRLEHRQLGRIDHQRRVHRAAHARHRLAHIGDLVAADEGGAEVKRVRALLDLVAGHLDAAVPIALLLELAELAGAVGVAALADREISVLLAQRGLAVERGDGRQPDAAARFRPRPEAVAGEPAQHGIECGDVRHVGAAAAADDVDAVLGDEALLPLRQLGRAQGIMRLPVDQLRQSGIGLHRDQARPVLAQPFDVLGHLQWAGGAVDADRRYVERLDHRRRGGDVGSHQQGAGGLHRDLDEDRRVLAGFGAGALGGVHRRLDLQRVLAGLDQQRVDAAGHKSAALHGERVLERLVVDMAERGQPGAGADRADDEARAAVAGENLDRLARQLGRAAVDVKGLRGDAEFAQRHRRAAEAVGLQRVGAGAQISEMDLAHEIGPALAEHVGAVLMAVIVALDIELARLHLRPHRAVAQQHPVPEIVENMRHGISLLLLGRRERARRSCGRWRR